MLADYGCQDKNHSEGGTTMAVKAKERETKTVAPQRSSVTFPHWERDVERMMEEFFGRRMRPWWPETWFRSEGMEPTSPAVDFY